MDNREDRHDQFLLIETLPYGYARHKVVTDDQGQVVDYTFLVVNKAFEEMTGLGREMILGSNAKKVLPDLEKGEFDWIGTFGKVALRGESISFEHYSEPLQRWYNVTAYSDQPGFFTTLFSEISIRDKDFQAVETLLALTEKLIGKSKAEIDFLEPSAALRKLTGASYVAINTYEENNTKTVTRAMAGLSSAVRQAQKILGFKIIGKSWEIKPDRLRCIEGGKLTRFASLHETSMGQISKKTSDLLHKIFKLGDIYVIELAYEAGLNLGDIIFFMPRGREIQNREVVEIYAGQLGSMLGRIEAEEKLYSKTAEYETVFHGTQSALFLVEAVYEGDGLVFRYIRNNLVHQEATGISTDQIRGKMPVELVGEDLGRTLEARYQECYNAKESISYEETLELPGGKRTWLTTLTPHFGRDCTVTHLVGSSEDITRRKEVEKNLKQSEEQLRQVTDNMLDMICKTDLNGIIEYASPSYSQLLGFKEEIVGKNVLDFVLEDDREKVAVNMQNAISEQISGRLDFRMKTGDGGYIWVESIGSLLYTDGQVSGAVFTTRDITDRKEAEEKIRYYSFHDQLTGLYNRNYFINEMKRLEDSRDYPIAIISADLDGLKLINDTLGHNMGDLYLQAGANLLKEVVRSSDLLARVGGDEFAMVLPGTDRKAARDLVERIYSHLESYNKKTTDLPLSISLGLAVSENKEMSLETTYHDADAMMYKEKLKRGKDHRTRIIQAMLSYLQKEGSVFNEKLQELSVKLGQAAGLDAGEIARLQLFARIYHLGLVNTPKKLLEKNAGLSEGEKERIRQHPERGYRIALASEELADVAELILYHHEKYDGSGYPRGLAGNEIPLPCRILSIVEAYLIFTGFDSDSPGRQPSEALAAIEAESGKSFDPYLVEKYTELIMAPTRHSPDQDYNTLHKPFNRANLDN